MEIEDGAPPSTPEPPTPGDRRGPPIPAVALLFLVSGASGLVYEVLWSRQLARVLGGSYPSVVATVAAFLGGLALGAVFGGRLAARTPRPLRAYGLLEIAIGAYCASFPLVLAALHPVFGWCYRSFADTPALHAAARFAVAAVALLPPTVAMGATLPILVRAVTGAGRASVLGGTGLLYGINTLGAAGGAMLTGFVLLPALGFTGTLYVGVAANLLVGAAALVLDRGPAFPAPAPVPVNVPVPVPVPGLSRGLRRALFVLAFGSGAASMLYQLGWTRALVLCFGSSVQAFTLIVSTFILGLGLGGLLAPAARRRGAGLAPILVLLEAAVGIAGWTSALLIADLPLAVVDVSARGGLSWAELVGWEFGRTLLLALPATLAMGAVFPVLIAMLSPEGDGASRTVARVYGVNVLGVLLGSLGGGMALLPAVGIRDVVLVAAAGNLLLAAVVAAAAFPRGRAVAAAAGLAGAAAAVFPLAPPWPPHLFHSGPYLYSKGYVFQAELDQRTVDREIRETLWDLPYEAEGRSVSVAVARLPEGGLSLRVNGKADASTARDMDTQLLIGHLPMLARPGAERVLVLGLASGVSAAAAASHGPKSMDVAEIAVEVAAAERYFRRWNGNVTGKPGVRVLLEDGRTQLEHGRETYDVIVSEPTNPWIAGVSDLFTKEYFEICRDRLTPGGVVAVWLHAYGLTLEDFRLIVRTVGSVFPDCTLWETIPGGDYVLLGSREGASDLVSTIAAREWPGGEAAASLAAAGIRSKEEALSVLFMDRAATKAFGEGGDAKDLHTDDRLQLEFRAPRTAFSPRGAAIVSPETLETFRSAGDPAALRGADLEKLRAARAGRAIAVEGLAIFRGAEFGTPYDRFLDPVLADPALLEALLPGVPPSHRKPLRERYPAPSERPPKPTDAQATVVLRAMAIRRLEEAYAAGCRVNWVRNTLGSLLTVRGRRFLTEDAFAEAEADFLRLREVQPDNAMGPYYLAVIRLRRAGARPTRADLEESLRLAKEALDLNPRCESAMAHRGIALLGLGRVADAVAALEETLAVRPDSVRALTLLASLLVDAGKIPEARTLLDSAERLEPDNVALKALRARIGTPP
jgi:spermidine synthase